MSCRYCPLFDGRKFQYGPACAFANGRRSLLVYYPLGSGKTLASVHGAATFLDKYPDGKIIVLTTLSNINTTWKKAIKMYRRAMPGQPSRALKHAEVHNPDWWYSQNNDKVAHYNKIMGQIAEDKKHNYTRRQLQKMTAYELLRISNKSEHKRAFKDALKQSSGSKDMSMLQLCVPDGPFCLIVDECQEYINLSAQTELVQNLADSSKFTMLLSATPVHDSRRLNGLRDLLHNPRDLTSSIVWTDFSEDVPEVVDSDLRYVQMTTEEWRAHQKAVRQKTSTGASENAYLTKSRQRCNNESKWRQIKEQIEEDIRESVPGVPVRIVVYSFFRAFGVDGFFKFLKREWQCKTEKKRLVHELGSRKIRVATNIDNTLAWFNKDSSRAKILLLTSKDGVGISLRNVRWFHLMEPQWSDAEDQQAIGRAVRKGSHDLVEPYVQVFRWLAVSPQHIRGLSAGEKVRAHMKEKKRRTDALLVRMSRAGDRYLEHLLRITKICMKIVDIQ